MTQTAECVLTIEPKEKKWRAALVATAAGWDELWQARSDYLHPREIDFLYQAGVRKRQADYLRGRYVAKRALTALKPRRRSPSIEVNAGIFGQPVVRGFGMENLQVSIAHSADRAVALAFDEGHPMAVDIQGYEDARIDVISQQCHENEWAALAPARLERGQAMITLWAAKESLAKVLRTGLLAPLKFYAIESAELAPRGVICTYENFPQYRTACLLCKRFTLAITLPSRSTLNFDELNQALAEF
jgi:4'-phosphopantetheinyl transferase